MKPQRYSGNVPWSHYHTDGPPILDEQTPQVSFSFCCAAVWKQSPQDYVISLAISPILQAVLYGFKYENDWSTTLLKLILSQRTSRLVLIKFRSQRKMRNLKTQRRSTCCIESSIQPNQIQNLDDMTNDEFVQHTCKNW
ncbi:unnamed protein product [Absidia cylindrospora]